MTTELVDEDESSLSLPSTNDVYQDLIRVRQHEGVSVSRIAKYGKNLQQLRISEHEFRKSGRQAGTLPAATITALDCAVRVHEPASHFFKVLSSTLNFQGMPGKLTDRQFEVMDWLGIESKTTYESVEKDVYNLFAYKIQRQATSFCSGRHPAEDIAKLPYDQRLITIRLLLELLVGRPRAEGKDIAEQLLQALPGLASVKHLQGKDPRSVVAYILHVVIGSRYSEAIREFRAKEDPKALFIPVDLFVQPFRPDSDPSKNYAVVAVIAKEIDLLLRQQFKSTGDEKSTDSAALADLGPIPTLALFRLALRGGLFFLGDDVTRRFETARRRSMTLLSRMLIDIDAEDRWDELLNVGQPQKPPTPPPTARPPRQPPPTTSVDNWFRKTND